MKMKSLNEISDPRTVAEVVFKVCCPGFSKEYTADVVEKLISRIEQAILDERERCAKIAERFNPFPGDSATRVMNGIADQIRASGK